MSAVTGYWVVKNRVTGHWAYLRASSADPSHAPSLTRGQARALGLSNMRDAGYYYLGGDQNQLPSEALKAFNALQVSTDQIPGDVQYFKRLLSSGFQAGNFDLLTPVGVDPNAYQQATSSVGGALQGGLTGILGGLSDWQQLAVRAMEALAGGALLLLGLQALTGQSANPIRAMRRAVR